MSLRASRPQLIAKCALRFASNWWIEPGATSKLVWTADMPWRPHGLRFGPNAAKLMVVQLKTTRSGDNLVQPMEARAFTPLMTADEMKALAFLNEGDPNKGIIVDVPYTNYAKRLRVRDPDHFLSIATLGAGEDLTLVVQNTGATSELVDTGAIFFAKPYMGDAT